MSDYLESTRAGELAAMKVSLSFSMFKVGFTGLMVGEALLTMKVARFCFV